mgnify:CR=1 FL=1
MYYVLRHGVCLDYLYGDTINQRVTNPTCVRARCSRSLRGYRATRTLRARNHGHIFIYFDATKVGEKTSEGVKKITAKYGNPALFCTKNQRKTSILSVDRPPFSLPFCCIAGTSKTKGSHSNLLSFLVQYIFTI